MKKVGIFSLLLILGLVGSQSLPAWIGEPFTGLSAGNRKRHRG